MDSSAYSPRTSERALHVLSLTEARWAATRDRDFGGTTAMEFPLLRFKSCYLPGKRDTRNSAAG